ncbi:MAG: prolipoprotein diacylglyceryl transferase family protein [Patescibacteria group bacterium]|nr:prolipoprotein diacylglyceryl transferase [Patescibacteria group bacterium]
MYPVLFSIAELNFYTASFFLAIGFFLVGFIVWRRFKNIGLGEELAIDLVLTSSVCGFLFSRLFYFLSQMDGLGLNPLNWLLVNKYPGFSFLGLILGIFLGIFLFSKFRKLSFFKIGDEIVYGLMPFLILLQAGAFFDGSGFGRPTTLPWGFYIPGSLVSRQPTSLFMILALALIWISLIQIERNWRSWNWYKTNKEGLIFLIFSGLVMLVNLLLAFMGEHLLYWYLFVGIASSAWIFGTIFLVFKFSKPAVKKTKGKKWLKK